MNRRSWLLISVAAVLTVLVVMDRFTGPAGVEQFIPTTGARQIRAVAHRYALSDFDEILRRPVFRADRKAKPDIVPDGTHGPAVFDRQLVGIVDGAERYAVLKGNDGEVSWVAMGQASDGWTLVGLGPSQAVFVRDGIRQTAYLVKPEADRSAAPSAPHDLHEAMATHPIIPTDAMLEAAKMP